jgi:hypothetical protein
VYEQPRDQDRPRGHHRAPGLDDYDHRASEDYGYLEPPEYPGQYGQAGPDEYLTFRRHRTHEPYPDHPDQPEPGYPEPGYPEEPAPRRPDPVPPRPARVIPPEAYQALFQQAVRKPRWPYALLVASVAFTGVVAGMLIGSRVHSHTPAAAAATAPATSPAAVSSAASAAAGTPSGTASPPAAGGPGVLARFSGSGAKTTRRFTVPGSGNWELKWSYDCASLGSKGHFAVTEDQAGTTGVTVNERGLHGRGVTHAYGDAGRHYLVVNSECAWRLTAVGQP